MLAAAGIKLIILHIEYEYFTRQDFLRTLYFLTVWNNVITINVDDVAEFVQLERFRRENVWYCSFTSVGFTNIQRTNPVQL